MITIHRGTYDSELNKFHGRQHVERKEIILKRRNYFGEDYTWAEPAEEGTWAFGGTILFTSNGIFPEFNTPIKLHDRDMSKERG